MPSARPTPVPPEALVSATRFVGRPASTIAAFRSTCALNALRMSATGSAVSFSVGSVLRYTGFPSAPALRSAASSIDGTVSVCVPAVDIPMGGGLRLTTAPGRSPA